MNFSSIYISMVVESLNFVWSELEPWNGFSFNLFFIFKMAQMNINSLWRRRNIRSSQQQGEGGGAQIGVQLQTLTHRNPSAPCKMDLCVCPQETFFQLYSGPPYLTNIPLAHHAGWIAHRWETLFHCIPIHISNHDG